MFKDAVVWVSSKILLELETRNIVGTRKRGIAQRIARPECANATVHFLLIYRPAMLLPPSE